MSEQTRTLISKSLRFEVFKRDRFTCQYCGRMAPDVILEVDHIVPVAEGGENNILNLITSCRDCNRGKGKRLLSDDDKVKKQQSRLLDLADRTEQTQMMLDWEKEMIDIRMARVDKVVRYIESLTEIELSQKERATIATLIERYTLPEVITSVDIAIARYFWDERSWRNTFKKIGGICHNRWKQRMHIDDEDEPQRE